MENAAEALKIAFAIAMFVMALTLSISSFSQANNAVNAIITQKDRDVDMEMATVVDDLGYEQYVYVEPSNNLSRIVGIETVISSLYRVPVQNLEVHFMESDGVTPMRIYKLVNADGTVISDKYTNYIDLAHPNLNFDSPTEFLDVLIGGKTVKNWEDIKEKYQHRLVDAYLEGGLYKEFKNAKFEERLGEYEQGTGTAKITKRVITYVLQ